MTGRVLDQAYPIFTNLFRHVRLPEPVEYQPRCRGQVVSEPPQASNRRSLVRAKTPRKTRGVLISIDSLCLLGRGGVARQNTSACRRIACLRTRRGGVNDPAGLPAWPPVRLHRCRWLGAPRGSANGKKHPPGGEGLSHSPADGGNHPSKATCLSSVVNSWQKGPFSPTGYVQQSEDRLCEPQSPRLDHQRCWITQLRPSWQRPVRLGSAIARAWWTSAWCWCCGTADCAARRPLPSSGPTSGAETTAAAVCSSSGARPIRLASAKWSSSPAGSWPPWTRSSSPRQGKSGRLRDDGQDDQITGSRGRVWSSDPTAVATIIR